MVFNSLKRRRSVEIYFVLYLSALILILPDFKNKNSKAENDFLTPIVNQDFELHPEKNVLTCSLYRDSTGLHIYSLDSINTIYYSGEVTDVKYEFTVEDQLLKQKLVLNFEDNFSTRFFRIEEHPEHQSALFFWAPPNSEKINKTYLVHVTATGIQAKNTDGKSKSNNTNGKVLKSKTRFSLNIVYINQEGQGQQFAQGLQPGLSLTQNNTNSQNIPQNFVSDLISQDITFQILSPKVEAIAYEKWSNKIYVFPVNLNRDIKGPPRISTVLTPENNGGSAYFSFKDNTIEVGGKTPFTGKMEVEISLIRKWDNKPFSTKFSVIPQPIRQPDFDRVMYPDITYKLKPNLPFLPNQEIKAQLKDGVKVIANSLNGTDLQFTPSISDTNKVLSFEIYIDDKLCGQINKIQVHDFHEPEILRMSPVSENKVRLETRSYGVYKGSENFVARIEVIEGNVKCYEKIGQANDKPDNMAHTQFWEIVPNKANDKLSDFKIRVIDKRGKKSIIKTYSGY